MKTEMRLKQSVENKTRQMKQSWNGLKLAGLCVAQFREPGIRYEGWKYGQMRRHVSEQLGAQMLFGAQRKRT